MYTPDEILAKVKRVSEMAIEAEKEKSKKRYSSEVARLFGDDYLEVLPDYYEGYDEAVEDFEAIRVHAEKNCFPAVLFSKRAPNQTEQAAKWIQDNYKNVTQPVYLDFRNTVLRCTHDQNWSITYGEDKQQFVDAGLTYSEYLAKSIENYGSLESYFKNVMFDLQLKDAMGVIAVKPKRIPTIEVNGELVIDSNQLIEPQPYYYTSKQVVGFEESYCLVETYEKSEVEYYGGRKRKGRIYEFYDDENIWVATQVGKYIDNQFVLTLYYRHEWGKVPCTRLRGVPYVYEGKILYQSPFLFATDLLDLVAQNSAYLQASVAKCVFPATIMLGDICTFEENGHNCNDGIIGWYDGDEYRSRICPRCNGVGLTSRLGALETMLIKPEVRGQQESELKSGGQKPLEYVSPETTTLEYLETNIDKREKKARQILHLHTSNSDVKGSEDMTATGMALDMKSTFAFILPIANTAFENFEFVLNAIGWMRYKDDFVKPTLVYPQTFDIGTERDILTTIGEMIKNQVPPVLIQSEIFRYLKSVYYTDSKTTAVYELLTSADRLLVLSSDEIAVKLATKLVEPWEVILHDSFMSFTEELLTENVNFLELPLETRIEQVKEKAKTKAAEIKTNNNIEVDTIEKVIV